MTISTVDDIIAGLGSSGRQQFNIFKSMFAPKGAGAFHSFWLGSGYPSAGSASPAYTAGSGYTCDDTTAGTLILTAAGAKLWLAKLSGTPTQTGTYILADRLWSCSGMGFAAGTYTVTTPGSLPARITDNGVGVEAWVEQFVSAGSASGTLTLNYLDSAGASKSGVISAVVSAPVAGQMQPIPLGTGVGGISQITSVVTSATWTSGSFGITLLKRIAEIPVGVAGIGVTLDWAQLGLPNIPDTACLMLFYQATNTSAANFIGNITIIDK